jgi:hypothetical protein
MNPIRSMVARQPDGPPIAGERTIVHDPDGPTHRKYLGRIDHPLYEHEMFTWQGSTPEVVETLMNSALGKVPTGAYQVKE